ncbi:hypothetical protein BST25_20295 [Mycobacterium heidelbergense]|uniref:Uncharacterized protein n=1 Tax=Mycobacterium heidelbergense TaxID=53376 RepID=A0A1X0DC73_MYCHE|nr:hypothetical protein [Mycobacterium heidelbergense]ORA69993.1 hypothetical protein BST25_20295 [Mycobacterium heidelbergense]
MIALMPVVSNDVAADLQHSATAVQQRVVELASTDYAVNPLQTWLDVFTNAAANLQTIGADWMAQGPAILAQQVAANWIEYASLYLGSYQSAANGALSFYTTVPGDPGNPEVIATDFWPTVTTALADLQSGQIAAGIDRFGWAFFSAPITKIFQPMENTLNIPIYLTQNLANATHQLLATPPYLSSVIDYLGAFALFDFQPALTNSLGNSLQTAYDAFAAGDMLDGVLNLLNTPGAVANGLINGADGIGGRAGGLLTPEVGLTGTGGLLPIFATWGPQQIAKVIVAPGAVNITTGGSLATAWGSFLNMAASGWPSPNEIVNNILNVFRTYGGLSGLGSAANVGGVASAAAAMSAQLPGLSVGVVKGFDPAAVTSIAGSLGPSLAAEVAGSLGANLAGSLATTLSVDLSRVALHILSAL